MKETTKKSKTNKAVMKRIGGAVAAVFLAAQVLLSCTDDLTGALNVEKAKNKELEAQNKDLKAAQAALEAANAELEAAKAQLASAKTAAETEAAQLAVEKAQLATQKAQLEEQKAALEAANAALEAANAALEDAKAQLASAKTEAEKKAAELAVEKAELAAQKAQLEEQKAALEAQKIAIQAQLDTSNASLEQKSNMLNIIDWANETGPTGRKVQCDSDPIEDMSSGDRLNLIKGAYGYFQTNPTSTLEALKNKAKSVLKKLYQDLGVDATISKAKTSSKVRGA